MSLVVLAMQRADFQRRKKVIGVHARYILFHTQEMIPVMTPETIAALWIEGEFTTLNEYIRAERGSLRHAAQIKRSETARVLAACRACGVPPVSDYPVWIGFAWGISNLRRDPDNIRFAAKFILDGMVRAGILRDDGAAEIAGFSYDAFRVTDPPGVLVTIYTRNVSHEALMLEMSISDVLKEK